MRRRIFLGFVLICCLLSVSFGYAATYDVTGQWDVNATNFQNDCGEDNPISDQYNVYVIQNGDAVTIVDVDGENSVTGTVSGATYTIHDTWYDYSDDLQDWVQIDETMIFTATSATQGSGTDSWTAPAYSCGGSSDVTLTRQAQNPATFDATGTWQYTTSNFFDGCGGAEAPPASGTLTITQTGTKVAATTVLNSQQVEYRGFLSDSTYTLVRSYPGNNGTVSQVFTIDLSNSGTGSGWCDWIWNDAYDSCFGWFDISMTRAPLAITASAGSGGNISPSGSVSVAYGGNQTFTITPNSGFRVKDVRVDGVSVGAKRSYTFSNVQSAHTIEALFEKSAAMPWVQLLLGE